MNTQANVLYDAPGPRAIARYRLYTVLLSLGILATLVWVGMTLNTNGQFESRIFERLFSENVFKAILEGLQKTLTAAALAIVASLALGLVLATGRLSNHSWIRLPASAFVEFFRAVPLLLMMIFLLNWIGIQAPNAGTQTRALFAVVGGLTLYNGCVLAEVFRAGVNAVPAGQGEAAQALGMRKGQVLRMILMPQGIKFMLPAIISQCVVVLKDTSLGYIVAYPELLREGKSIATYVGSSLWTFAVIALIYIALNSIVSQIAHFVQRRMERRGAGPSKDTAAAKANAAA